VPTFLDNLQAQGVIAQRTFSLYLSNNPNGNDTKSELIIGGYDTRYMTTPNFVYLPVVQNVFGNTASYFYWSVGLAGVSLGNVNINLQTNTALVDSGTTMIVAPTSDWPAFAVAFMNSSKNCSIVNAGGVQLAACPCTGTPAGLSVFPNLTFNLGSGGVQSSFSLTPAQYLSYSSGYCIAMVQELQDINLWILGDVFMINFYTYFNEDTLMIGFAPANPNPAPLPAATANFALINSIFVSMVLSVLSLFYF